MFKAARWRSEKNKIKATFELRFHATQVPRTGWETMMVTLVPLDAAKPTARSEKAAVIGEACHWMNPVRETVKLVQDPKTGRINEKVYRLLVSAAGSAKCELLGEISVNLANYAEECKPITVSLPIKPHGSAMALHVTIQKVHADVEGRDGDENGDTITNGGEQTKKVTSQSKRRNKEDGANKDTSFRNSQAQLRHRPNNSRYMFVKPNGNVRNSRGTNSTSASGSDCSSGQYTQRENGTDNNEADIGLASSPSPLNNKGIPQKEIRGLIDLVTDYTDYQNRRLVSDCSPNLQDRNMAWAMWSTNSSAETGLRERLQDSDASPGKHRSEDAGLPRQLEVWELELQTLRKQVVMEKRWGQDLSVELCGLKEERDALKRECEELRGSKERIGNENVQNNSLCDGEDLQSLLEEIKEELNHEKSSNAYLRLQLEKTQESNTELILAVRDLEELLEQKNSVGGCTKCGIVPFIPATTENFVKEKSVNGLSHARSCSNKKDSLGSISDDDGQHALEELLNEHNGVKAESTLEQKIADLNNEIELYKKDIEDQDMYMEQLALDYEILQQENHAISSKLEQVQLWEQLRMQYDCLAHVSIITDLETQVKNLEKELDEQADAFEADIETITRAKVEQEQRAIRAEELLRKTRWNNANTAEQLKIEFEKISAQIASTFEMNERLATEGVAEAAELRLQKCHLEDLLAKTNEELTLMRSQCHVKLQEVSNLLDLKTKESDTLLLKLKQKSEELENQKKYEDESHATFSKGILVAEIEQLKASVKDTEMVLHERNLERDMLDAELSSIEEVDKSMKELHDLKQAKDESETMITILNSEVTALRTQYNDLKRSLSEDELEKENLRKQVFQLRNDLRKKDETMAAFERKLKDNNIAGLIASDGTTKSTTRNKNVKPIPTPNFSKDAISLREKIRHLEGKIKSKDAAMEQTKSSFLKKERDLSNRIEELERRVCQNQPDYCEGIIHKMQGSENLDKNFGGTIGKASLQRKIDEKEGTYDIRDTRDVDSKRSTKKPGSENGEERFKSDNCDRINIAEVVKQMHLVEEKNSCMEAELKEMQERYSEISLKFAEVEGERQQHVMTIRSLRSALKK